MFFGKRKSAEPPRQKIIPDELFQGEMGKILRDAGLSPDDEQNLLATPESVAARLASERAAFETKLRKLNDDIHARTGGWVQPFYIFPEPCWNGETGHFLTIRMRMSPYEEWNLALLPEDPRFCEVLGLPLRPSDPMIFHKHADEFLRAKMAQLDAARVDCDHTNDFAVFKKRQDDLKDVIRSFAGWLLEQYTEAWRRSSSARA